MIRVHRLFAVQLWAVSPQGVDAGYAGSFIKAQIVLKLKFNPYTEFHRGQVSLNAELAKYMWLSAGRLPEIIWCSP